MKLTKELFSIAETNYSKAVDETQQSCDDYSGWIKRIQQLSTYCKSSNKTFIAALGTAILAKTLDANVNPYALKAKGLENGYSARGLCQHVLAALAPKLGIDLGVTGREPLNNQPFFAKESIHRELPVKDQDALNFLVDCLDELNKIKSKENAFKVLKCFVYTRKKILKTHNLSIDVEESKLNLINFIERFIKQDPEHGKRAQATVAGVMDTVFENVEVDKIHDPDRNFPGDVISRDDDGNIIISIEVRDKQINEADIYAFAEKMANSDLRRGAMIGVNANQQRVDSNEIQEWLEDKGLLIHFFFSWADFIDSLLFWSSMNDLNAQIILAAIFNRAKELEVTSEGLELFT